MKLHKKIFNNEITYIALGILTMACWLIMFLIGLFVDSAYYRVALTSGFGELEDWLWATVSFFVSNVAILAFLSGLLGGLCSKLIATRGFSLTDADLQKQNVNYILYENPFISAFRGVFMFMAILSIQYLSSFTELGGIEDKTPNPIAEEVRDNKVYLTLLERVKDTASLDTIRKIWEQEEHKMNETNNDSLINKVILYRDSLITYLPFVPANQQSFKRRLWEERIRVIRSKLKVPPVVDIPGISSASYFKFAVIVSLLAFICGYDPTRFNALMTKIPILAASGKKDKDENKTT